MIRYIDDYINCDQCGEEVNEGYRIGYETFCKDCLEELRDELNNLFKYNK